MCSAQTAPIEKAKSDNSYDTLSKKLRRERDISDGLIELLKDLAWKDNFVRELIAHFIV
jgi:hypothetical protein